MQRTASQPKRWSHRTRPPLPSPARLRFRSRSWFRLRFYHTAFCALLRRFRASAAGLRGRAPATAPRPDRLVVVEAERNRARARRSLPHREDARRPAGRRSACDTVRAATRLAPGAGRRIVAGAQAMTAGLATVAPAHTTVAVTGLAGGSPPFPLPFPEPCGIAGSSECNSECEREL